MQFIIKTALLLLFAWSVCAQEQPQILVHCNLKNVGEVLDAKTGKARKAYEATCDISLANGRVLMPPKKLVLPQSATYGEASEAIHDFMDNDADKIILEALRKKN